jgi:hypothetical protein
LATLNLQVPAARRESAPVLALMLHTVGVLVAKLRAPVPEPELTPLAGTVTVGAAEDRATEVPATGAVIAIGAWAAFTTAIETLFEIDGAKVASPARVAVISQLPTVTGETTPELETVQIVGVALV